jgi:hypothetical protein
MILVVILGQLTDTVLPLKSSVYRTAPDPFHFKVPFCDLWENGKIYDIDSCRDYVCGLKH